MRTTFAGFFFFHDKFHSIHTLISIVTKGNFILHLLPLLSSSSLLSSHFTKLSRSWVANVIPTHSCPATAGKMAQQIRAPASKPAGMT